MSNQTPPAAAPITGRRSPFPLEASQARIVAVYVRGMIQSLVRREPMQGILPPVLANARLMGARLTLHRAGEVSRCVTRYASMGQLELDHSLGYLMSYLASRVTAATAEQPALSAEELPALGLKLTLMFDSFLIDGVGEDRMQQVDPLSHGLLVEHPAGEGIVLPDPGSDWPTDAPRYLAMACQQAKLPADAWRRDDRTRLMSFLTQDIELEPQQSELSWLSLNGLRMNALVTIAQRAARLGARLLAKKTGDSLLDQTHPSMLAVRVTTQAGLSSWAAGKDHSLAALAHVAGRGLQSQPADHHGHAINQLTVYMQAVELSPVHDERLQGQTFLVQGQERWQLITDAATAGEALVKAGLEWMQWFAGEVAVWKLTGRSQDVRVRTLPDDNPTLPRR